MLNLQNIFCGLIEVEYCFWTMKVYPIRPREFKKNDNTPPFICEKDISLIVRPSWKNHNLDYYLANKISKTDVNQQNILIVWPLDYISIIWTKENYALLKFHFQLKCNELVRSSKKIFSVKFVRNEDVFVLQV